MNLLSSVAADLYSYMRYFKVGILGAILVISAPVLSQETDLASFLNGKVVLIKDAWAGQALEVKMLSKGEFSVCHMFLGSGVMVASESLYPVEVISSQKMKFVAKKPETKYEFLINLEKGDSLVLYLNGFQLQAPGFLSLSDWRRNRQKENCSSSAGI